MDSDFDVDDIESLENAAHDLNYYFNFYSGNENFINTDVHLLVEDIKEILNPYTTLYNNEEYNPFDSLSSVSKYILGKNLSTDTKIFVYDFSVTIINAALMKTKFLLAKKVLENATVMGDDYLSQWLNFFNDLVNDKKYMIQWVTFYENEVNTSESSLRMITDHIEKSVFITYITADETSPEYNYIVEDVRIESPKLESPRLESPRLETPRLETPRLESPRPAPAPGKKYTRSYMSSFLPFMSRKGKKKGKKKGGGMATRKKKYRRRYKKQIKRRTKKNRSKH